MEPQTRPAEDGLDQQHLSDVGLEWDEAARRLVDPETGEVIDVAPVVDDATAVAASYRLMCNAKAIEHLDAQIKELQARKKQREKRAEYLLSLYRAGLITVARAKIEDLGNRKQSTLLGYVTVGWSTTKPSVKVRDERKALDYVLAASPKALKLEVDVNKLPDAVRPILLTAITDPFGEERLFASGVEGAIRTTLIAEDERGSLPADAFDVHSGGEQGWYVRPPSVHVDPGLVI